LIDVWDRQLLEWQQQQYVVKYTAALLTDLVAVVACSQLRTAVQLETDIHVLPGNVQAGGQKLICYEEVQKHNKRGDCWVIIEVSCTGL
jgi:hypothetical protein